MAGLLPPVVATLLADTKEYSAKMDEATGKMEEFGAASDTTGSRLSGFASKASTAIIGVGVAFAAYATVEAYKFQSALDQLKNTTNVTASELQHIKTQSLAISDATGQSAVNIVGAYQAVEAAGYKRAAADKAVAASAKLALITEQPVATTTQALVAAQNLGITSGMSSAKVADLLTIALKGNENGLQGVIGLLTGKVGSAFAAYHQSAGEAVAVANEFSMAGITQTRQIATFVNKLGALQGPMQTTEIENGKLTTTSAGYVNSLVDVGLNVDKTRDAFTGPNGLVNGLKYLKTTADGSLPKLQQYLAAIFGATGVGAGTALIRNINTLSQTITKANGASGSGLNAAATVASGQLDNQLKIIEERLKNAAIEFGLHLLPYVEKAADVIVDAMDYLDKHPDVLKGVMAAAGALFAAAVGYKLTSAVQSIWGSLNAKAQTSLLSEIAANTAKTAAEGGIGDAEGGGAASVVGKGSLVAGAGIGAFLGTTELLRHNFLGLGTAVNKAAGFLYDLSGGGKNGTTGLAGKTKSTLGKAGLDNIAQGTTGGLTTSVLQYLDNKNKGGGKKSVTVKVKVTK